VCSKSKTGNDSEREQQGQAEHSSGKGKYTCGVSRTIAKRLFNISFVPPDSSRDKTGGKSVERNGSPYAGVSLRNSHAQRGD
jgi:hypothetical protein